MGLPVSLALRGRHAADARAVTAWDQAMAILDEADRTFSTYRPDSVISRLARGELAEDDCPPEVCEVLALGRQAELESGGAFAVRRREGGSEVLDPSGVVKGWAIERAAEALRVLPGTDFCLSAGGDMVCHVASPESPEWRIGIEHPLDPSKIVAVVPVRNGAVATSGTAHRGQHIVDARSGLPADALASVTVVAPSLTWADIDATAAFALGEDAAAWLETRRGHGIVVHLDGRVELTGGTQVAHRRRSARERTMG